MAPSKNLRPGHGPVGPSLRPALSASEYIQNIQERSVTVFALYLCNWPALYVSYISLHLCSPLILNFRIKLANYDSWIFNVLSPLTSYDVTMLYILLRRKGRTVRLQHGRDYKRTLTINKTCVVPRSMNIIYVLRVIHRVIVLV